MKKLAIILLILSSMSLSSDSVSFYEDDFIIIENIDENFSIKKRPFNVMEMNNNYYLHLQYSFKLKGELTNSTIIFKIKEGVTPDFLLKLIGKEHVKFNPAPYGLGEIYEIANETGLTTLSTNVSRYAQDWGSSVSKDIVIYKLKYNSEVVEEILIQLLNVWPNTIDMPYIVDNSDIDKFIQEENEIASKYNFYDSLISEKMIIKNFYGE